MPSDIELMLRLKSGDSAALGPLVLRRQSEVLNTAYKMLGDRESAEDVAQQTFLKVLRSAPAYTPQAQFKTWLYTIVLNLCRDKLRQSTRRPTISLDAPRPTQPDLDIASSIPDTRQRLPEELIENEERSRLVRSALASLPENQREALALKTFAGLSYGEISEILGTTEKAVDSLLWRARESLRKALTPYFKAEGF